MSAAVSTATLDAAIAWRLRMESGEVDARGQEAFGRWLDAAADHRRAWQQLESLDGRFAAVDASARSVLLRARPAPRAARGIAGALLLVCAGLLAVNRYLPLPDLLADQVTATGERREMILSDHTRLMLDTRSAVDVAFGQDERRLVLRRGGILVETGHGDLRPFVVQTGDGELRPLGTRFIVRSDAGGTSLIVLADVVAAKAAGGVEQHVSAGQSLRLRAGERPRTAAPGADAWTHGMLAADDMRLADVVAELGRYRPGVLAVDPRLAELRVTGSFPLHDIDLATQALAQTLPLRVQRRSDWWITLEPEE